MHINPTLSMTSWLNVKLWLVIVGVQRLLSCIHFFVYLVDKMCFPSTHYFLCSSFINSSYSYDTMSPLRIYKDPQTTVAQTRATTPSNPWYPSRWAYCELVTISCPCDKGFYKWQREDRTMKKQMIETTLGRLTHYYDKQTNFNVHKRTNIIYGLRPRLW